MTLRSIPSLTAPALAAALTLLAGAPVLAQTAAPAASAPAAATAEIGGTYQIDPDHSHVVFSYDHMGYSTSHGMISGVSGTVVLDKANPAASTVEATFPLSAIQTMSPTLNEHIAASDEFFKGAAPATAVTFKSTSVKVEDDDKAEVTGDLTLNGVTKPVTLETKLTKADVNPMSGKPAVGFEIEGKILRSDFNLGAFAPAVSDEVELDIAIEAAKD